MTGPVQKPTTNPDWTVDPATGRSNSSATFLMLTEEIARTIRGGAHSLLAGNAEGVARVVLARLAHIHGMAPSDEETAQT